jgi:hypothetical protein
VADKSGLGIASGIGLFYRISGVIGVNGIGGYKERVSPDGSLSNQLGYFMQRQISVGALAIKDLCVWTEI